ncbi:MAG: efflux RND transporter permease subunit, partial [Myxococcota bacterium]
WCISFGGLRPDEAVSQAVRIVPIRGSFDFRVRVFCKIGSVGAVERVRMRPVLMTSGALVFGLIPVAFGVNSGSEFRAPMGMMTIGGLLTSTLLTLIVVPVVYSLLDRVSERLAALGGRLVSTRGARAVGEPLG